MNVFNRSSAFYNMVGETNLSNQRMRMLLLTLLPMLALYGISAYHITVTVNYLSVASSTREVT